MSADTSLSPNFDSPAAEPTIAPLLLSLPTLAQAAYAVIVIAFVGIFVAAVVGNAPVRMWPIVLSLVLLPARAVLASPERTRRLLEDRRATDELRADGTLARLEGYLAQVGATAYGLPPTGVIIARPKLSCYIVGSWRRNYLVLGSKAARRIADELDKAAPAEWVRALLLHELAHVAHRDPQRIGFTGELLRGAFVILPWWVFFLAFWIGMALQGIAAALAFDFAGVPGMPSELAESVNQLIAVDPQMAADMMQRAAEMNYASLITFVVLSLWPIGLVAGILYLFFWRWMVRLQEHYADLNAIRHGIAAPQMRTAGIKIPALQATARRLRRRPKLPNPTKKRSPVRLWFAAHPGWVEREQVMAAPERLFLDWKRVAWSTAILSIALDVIYASPLFLYHSLPVHLYPLTALVLLSTWLLPQLALGQPVARPLGRVLLLVAAVRGVWLALNIGMLAVQMVFFPAAARNLLNAVIIAGSRYVGYEAGPALDTPATVGAMVGAVGQQALEFGGLLAAVLVYVLVQRRDTPAVAARRHWPLVAVIAVGAFGLMWALARLVGL